MTILVYDGSNLIHRSFYVASNQDKLRTDDEIIHYTVKLTLQTIFKLIGEYEARKAYAFFDRTPRNQLIHSLKIEEDLEIDDHRYHVIGSAMEMTTRFLNSCSVLAGYMHGMEADDLAYVVAKEHTMSGSAEPLALISSDQDWYQGISPTVSHWNPIQHKETTVETMINWYGEHYRLAYVAYYSLVRNKDGIPGVRGIGETTAEKIMNLIYSPEDNYLKVPTSLPVAQVYYDAFMNDICNWIKSWEAIDLEWIYRSGHDTKVLSFLSELEHNITSDKLEANRIIRSSIGNDRMGACIRNIDAYIVRYASHEQTEKERR